MTTRLGRFIFLILLSVVIVFFIVNFLIQRIYILPIYRNLEEVSAINDINRCVDSIYSEINHLSLLNHDWAAWDDTYNFVLNKNKKYINSNLQIDSLIDNKLDLMLIYNDKKKLIWGNYVEKNTFSKQRRTYFDNYLRSKLSKTFCNSSSNKKSSTNGIISTKYGFYILSIEPILTSKNKGPCRGTLIMGSKLAPIYIKKISERTNVKFDIAPATNTLSKDLIKFIKDEDTNQSNNPHFIKFKNNNVLKIYSVIDGICNNPVLLIEAEIPRKIFTQGSRTLSYSLYTIILIGIILLSLMIAIIHFFIIKPILKLTNHAMHIKSSHTLEALTFDKRKDEIGILSREFNNMLIEIKNINDNLEERIIQRTNEIMDTRKNSIFRLAKAAENRDTDTGLHLKRIQVIATLLAIKSGIEQNTAEMIGLASTLHDIGKIGILDEILFKKGKFNDIEYNTMKQHTLIGAKILENGNSDLIEIARIIALYHHERWDGKGYPKGLKGAEIPLAAQITSIADVFDALVSARVYKDPWSYEKIKKYFEENSGTQFNPNLTKIFIDFFDEFVKIRKEYNDNK